MLTQQSSSTVASVPGKLVRETLPFICGALKQALPLIWGVGCKSLPSWFGERVPGWFVRFLTQFCCVKKTNLRIVYIVNTHCWINADLMLAFPKKKMSHGARLRGGGVKNYYGNARLNRPLFKKGIPNAMRKKMHNKCKYMHNIQKMIFTKCNKCKQIA